MGTGDQSDGRARLPYPLALALFAAAYAAGVAAGHFLALDPGQLVVFWPPSGLYLATLLVAPVRRWPGFVLAAVVVGVSLNLGLRGFPAWAGVGFAVATTAEAVVGAALLRRWFGGPLTPARSAHVFGLAAVAVVVAAPLAALIRAAAASLALGSFPREVLVWWLGDVLGVLMLAPLVLTVAVRAWATEPAMRSPARWAELAALLGLLAATSHFVCGAAPPAPVPPIALFPLVMWAAIRFGPAGVSAALLVLAPIAAWHTAAGVGPFAGTPSPEGRAVIWAIIFALFGLIGLVLAALWNERQQAEAALRAANAELEARVRDRTAALSASEAMLREFLDASPVPMGLVELADDGRDIRHAYDNPATCRFFGVPAGATAGRWASELGASADTIRAWAAAYRTSGSTGEPVRFDYRHPDDRWLAVVVAPVGPGPDGRRRFGYVSEDVTDRRRAEAVLRRSHDTFLRLVEDAPFGVYLVDADFRLARVSAGARPVFAGIDPLIGRDFAEVLGVVWPEPFASGAVARFRHTLATGEAYHSADTTERRGNIDAVESYDWRLVRVALPDGRFGVVCYFYDMTAVRRAAARDAYRVRLADALRPLADATAIQAEAARVLGRHLAASRAFYGEVLADDAHLAIADNYTDGAPPIVGTFEMAAYGPALVAALRAGQTVVESDLAGNPALTAAERAAHAALVVGAVVAVPLVKGGRFAALLAVSQAGPRAWTAGEVALVEETAERTWAAVERAKAEAAVRAAEERSRLAQAAAGVGVWDWAAASGASYWSESMWTLYGHPPRTGPVPPDLWPGHLHPDDRGRVLAGVAEALASGRAEYRDEFRVVRADGAVRWVEAVARVERDAAGRPARMFGVNVDLTDRKAAEEARRESEERFRLLANTVPSVVWTAAPDGTITFANDRWFEYCGLTPERNARGWPELVLHPDDYDRCRAEWAKALAAGTEYEIEVRNRRHDGAHRWFVTRAVPVRGPDGAVAAWFGVTTDIHEQKEADRRKDEFITTLAHELRNPLGPIRNAVHVLAQSPDPDVARKARDTIDRQATHMARLVEDLLDVARISQGKVRLAAERCDLAAVVRQTAEDYRGVLERAGVGLDVDAAAAVWVDGDAGRLAQVVGNVLHNANKFTDRGGRVAVGVAADGGSAVVTVRDTGAGMDRTTLARVFEAFAAGAEARNRGGLGVGLALVKGLVELHGGSAAVHSDGPGTGTTVTLRVPLAAAPTEPARPVTPAAPRRRKVLVIDDSRDAADSTQMLLELHGHEVRVAYDGPSGLRAAAADPPDVVICDINLRNGIDGYDVARAVRADAALRGVYLIAQTGHDGHASEARAADAGFDVLLTKPVPADRLQRVLAGLS